MRTAELQAHAEENLKRHLQAVPAHLPGPGGRGDTCLGRGGGSPSPGTGRSASLGGSSNSGGAGEGRDSGEAQAQAFPGRWGARERGGSPEVGGGRGCRGCFVFAGGQGKRFRF